MTGHVIEVKQVAPQPTIVVRRQSELEQLSNTIPEASKVVWNFLTAMDIQQVGRNVVLYQDQALNLEVGVEVNTPVEAQPPVISSQLPGGPVAVTVHMGSYEQLPAAHRAILDWCEQHQMPLAGPNWEIYDHWSDDPAQRRTFVHYLLHEH